MTELDISQLVAQIVALLAVAAPYFKSIPTGAAEHLGAKGVEQAGRLLAWLRKRLASGQEERAQQTLALFLDDPATFQEALARLLAELLRQHPEWVSQAQALLDQQPLQQILARNDAVVQEVRMRMRGRSGRQIIDADDSLVSGIDMDME